MKKVNTNQRLHGTIDQHEIAFQADLDGDGLTTIETNGDFKIFGGSETILLW